MRDYIPLIQLLSNFVILLCLYPMVREARALAKKEKEALAKMEKEYEILRKDNPILDEVMKQDSKKNDK